METQLESSKSDIDLLRLWQVALRRKWIIFSITLIVTAVTVVVNLSIKPLYEAKALLLIEKEKINTVLPNGVTAESTDYDYYQTQYKILESRTLAEEAFRQLDIKSHPEFDGPNPFGKFAKSVSIKPVLRSRLVYIVATSHDPVLATHIANTWAKVYLKQNLENKLFLSKELLQVLTSGPEGFKLSTIESLPAVVNSQLIQLLKGEYAKLEVSWAELSQRYTSAHPRLMELRNQMAVMKNQIHDETWRIAQSVRTQLSGQLQGNNVRIIDPATAPSKPVAPNKRGNVMLAFFLSLLGSLGLALLIDHLDLSIRNQDDMEKILKIPFLGSIPIILELGDKKHETFSKIWMNENTHGAEAFRNLRTSISFTLLNIKGPTTLVTTSTVAGEGKTLVSSNLAIAFAHNAEKTLLVDGDLRRPNIHRLFKVSNERGLSNLLSSADAPENYLLPSGIDNLSIIPCGPIPPNPAELLNQNRLQTFIYWAMQNFDRIVIDTTPIFPVTDSLLWAKQAHGTIFVANAGEVKAVVVKKAIQKLQASLVKILGGVVNCEKWERGTGYYYQYYHYHYTANGQKAAGKLKETAAP